MSKCRGSSRGDSDQGLTRRCSNAAQSDNRGCDHESKAERKRKSVLNSRDSQSNKTGSVGCKPECQRADSLWPQHCHEAKKAALGREEQKGTTAREAPNGSAAQYSQAK